MIVATRDSDLDDLTVDVLRGLFRNLLYWRSLVENTVSGTNGLDVESITNDGVTWVIWDIERLYEVSQKHLPKRQAQAIHMFLVMNMREREVARLMGISESNPIGMYATDGLKRLIEMVQSRTLPN